MTVTVMIMITMMRMMIKVMMMMMMMMIGMRVEIVKHLAPITIQQNNDSNSTAN